MSGFGSSLTAAMGAGMQAFQGVTGIIRMKQAQQLTQLSGEISASTINQQALQRYGSDTINTRLRTIEENRKFEMLNRDIQVTLGIQKAQMAATGFTEASKSFQQIRTETFNIMANEVTQFRADSYNTALIDEYEKKVRILDSLNRAEAARWGAQVQAIDLGSRASQATLTLASQSISVLGQQYNKLGSK